MDFISRDISKLSRSKYTTTTATVVSNSSSSSGTVSTSTFSYEYIGVTGSSININEADYIFITGTSNNTISITGTTGSGTTELSECKLINDSNKTITITNSINVRYEGIRYEANALSILLYPSDQLISVSIPDDPVIQLTMLYATIDAGEF